jgi:hypothetical protein
MGQILRIDVISHNIVATAVLKKKMPEEMGLVLQYKLPCIGGTQAQTGYKSWHTTTMENDRYMICINPHIKCLYFSPQTYKGTNVHTYCWTYDRASYLVHIDSEYNHSKKKEESTTIKTIIYLSRDCTFQWSSKQAMQ